MSLSTAVILSAIVAMFAVFIVVIGVVSTWLNVENALAARRCKTASSPTR